jgi:hypothetical protein
MKYSTSFIKAKGAVIHFVNVKTVFSVVTGPCTCAYISVV